MSNKGGCLRGHLFHGDIKRFEVVAEFVFLTFGRKVKYIADAAGGRGMLARILNKKYNYEAEVIDPRGYTLVGVPNRTEEYRGNMAPYYDLIIGLHPDEATKEIVESARKRPTIIIPCCNYWDRTKVLGTRELVAEIERWYQKEGIRYDKVVFDFEGPKNVGLVTF